MQSFFYSIYKYILCSHIWNIVNIFFCYHLCSRFFKFVNKYFYIVVYIIVFLFCFPNHLCSRFIYIIKSGVAKKNKNGESTYISLQKQFCHTASLRSASRPFGASRGLLTRSRAYVTTYFPRGLHKPIAYNYAKTFFILVSHIHQTVF